MANARSKATGRTKYTVLLEVVGDAARRPYARPRVSEAGFFEVGEVAELLRDLQVAIGEGRKEYFLGAIVVERKLDYKEFKFDPDKFAESDDERELDRLLYKLSYVGKLLQDRLLALDDVNNVRHIAGRTLRNEE